MELHSWPWLLKLVTSGACLALASRMRMKRYKASHPYYRDISVYPETAAARFWCAWRTLRSPCLLKIPEGAWHPDCEIFSAFRGVTHQFLGFLGVKYWSTSDGRLTCYWSTLVHGSSRRKRHSEPKNFIVKRTTIVQTVFLWSSMAMSRWFAQGSSTYPFHLGMMILHWNLHKNLLRRCCCVMAWPQWRTRISIALSSSWRDGNSMKAGEPWDANAR